jgi:hypothetical protein
MSGRTAGRKGEKQLTHEEAERWCEKRELRYVKFPLPAVKEDGIPARVGWDVSGFAYPQDRAKDKLRIHEIGASLVEAVQKAKIKYDCIGS